MKIIIIITVVCVCIPHFVFFSSNARLYISTNDLLVHKYNPVRSYRKERVKTSDCICLMYSEIVVSIIGTFSLSFYPLRL